MPKRYHTTRYKDRTFQTAQPGDTVRRALLYAEHFGLGMASTETGLPRRLIRYYCAEAGVTALGTKQAHLFD